MAFLYELIEGDFLFDTSQFPVLGLGVSLSLGEEPSPLSLFQNTQYDVRPQFIEYAGLCDSELIKEHINPLLSAQVPLLFHPSFINFCGSFKNDDKWLATANEHIKAIQSPWFAQDCAYCFFSEGQGYSSQFAYFIPPILNAASLACAVQRVNEVQALIPTPILIEPPPVTFVVGNMPVFEFFGKLAQQSNCGLLLDMGHLVSYEMATGVQVLHSIECLPVERVIELHIAGGKLLNDSSPVYIDAHEENILDEVWHMFDSLLPLLPNVKAVCFECEGIDEAEVFSVLALIKKKIIQNSASPELVNSICIYSAENEK